MVRSAAALANMRPSGENARPLMSCLWPARMPDAPTRLGVPELDLTVAAPCGQK